MTNFPQQFYPQQETKIDYMKMVLQGLAALLLMSLITLAWSVRSWLLSRAEQNLAERQAPPAAALNTTVRAEVQQQPPTPPLAQPQYAAPQQVQVLQQPAPVQPQYAAPQPIQAIQQPAPVQLQIAAPQPVQAPQQPAPVQAQMAAPQPAPAPQQQETRADAGISSSVDQAVASLGQQSAARQRQAAPVATPDLRTMQPATKEDAVYVSALSVQYQDRGKPTEQLSDAELAKRINAGSTPQAASGKAVDTTNKILLAAADTGRTPRSELDALAIASLQRIRDEKAGIAAPAASYLQGLQQEAAIRENEARTYVVQAGDTLSHISARSYGSGTQFVKIYRANPTLITDPNRIYIGQVLRVPL